MFKSVIILYVVVFSTYIFFSRQPDYLDGECVKAIIHIDSCNNNSSNTVAQFFTNGISYKIKAGYLFRNLKEGETVTLIYETAEPQKAKIYSWWGYWITWGEILFSVLLLTASYFVAHSITKNPSPEALQEQLDYEPEHKRKYDL